MTEIKTVNTIMFIRKIKKLRKKYGFIFLLYDFFSSLVEYLNQHPSFCPGQWAALLNLHQITYVAYVISIMSIHLRETAHKFTIERMLNFTFHQNHNGFIHFVTHHFSNDGTT